MRTRRLFSSFAGSVVVAVLMGCNAIVGTEDIEYVDPTDPADQETGPEDDPDADRDSGGSRDGGADARKNEDAEAGLGDDSGGGSMDGGSGGDV
ncbi:MAG: hypothetical protein KF764_11105 [Labilithrix sp.]|nr:hypothetical protein [Labilithrix sp.]MBX3223828.1 hypothetical protein [Labilithrix sp.]